MYRAGTESILGLRIAGPWLHFEPCIPNAWSGFEITLRWRSARLHITVENPAAVSHGVASARLDGILFTERPLRFKLADDGRLHELAVILG
jgi:cyclic beta-1,2-glucan synthetase